MPIMNGYEACTRIRKNTAKESIRELLGFGGAVQRRSTQLVGGPVIDHRSNLQDDDLPKEKVLIVALSGLITESVIERGQKCGFDEFSNLIKSL